MRATVLTLIALLGLSAAATAAIGNWTPTAAAVLIAWGLAYGAIPLAMQAWGVTAHTHASPLYIATFQGSIAVGSLAGGRIVDAAGNTTATYGGSVLAAAALALSALPGRARVVEATKMPNVGSAISRW